ncbi:MAG TPA: RNA polymerase factor sigma-32 [Kofleriaceae bacterium]|nr:RNA polymerase factor sigma-32 [Kofleriaceae bacterium]
MVASKSKGTGTSRSGTKRVGKVIDVEADGSAHEADDAAAPGTDDNEDSDGDDTGADDGVDAVDVEILGNVATVAAPDGADEADGTEVVDDTAEPPVVKGGALSRRDPMAVYMSEVRRFPLLTPEEEHALAVRLVEHGDRTAARKLVEANLRLVVKIAYEYRRAHRNLLDLVQEGNIGLMQAVSKYDPYRGVKLSSYAAFWIRAYILKFILNNWRLVKIGTTQAQRKLFFNLRKEREKLEQLGFAPTAKALAEKLDVTENEVIEMEKRLAAPEASLDAPMGSEDDGQRTRMDYLPSESARPDQAVANNEFATLLRSKLEEFAQELEGRDQHIFRERWLTDEPQTLQEIGDKYGVSRERARQLEKRMLDRLRKFLESELGSAVDIGAMSRE